MKIALHGRGVCEDGVKVSEGTLGLNSHTNFLISFLVVLIKIGVVDLLNLSVSIFKSSIFKIVFEILSKHW